MSGVVFLEKYPEEQLLTDDASSRLPGKNAMSYVHKPTSLGLEKKRGTFQWKFLDFVRMSAMGKFHDTADRFATSSSRDMRKSCIIKSYKVFWIVLEECGKQTAESSDIMYHNIYI